MIGVLKPSQAGDRQAACQCGHLIRLRSSNDASVSAYIPDMSCQDSKRTPGLKKPVDVKMIAAIHTKSGPPLRLGRKGTGASGDGVGHAGKLLPWRELSQHHADADSSPGNR
jgi:hypothetical protein